jgi:hypothetical protein
MHSYARAATTTTLHSPTPLHIPIHHLPLVLHLTVQGDSGTTLSKVTICETDADYTNLIVTVIVVTLVCCIGTVGVVLYFVKVRHIHVVTTFLLVLFLISCDTHMQCLCTLRIDRFLKAVKVESTGVLSTFESWAALSQVQHNPLDLTLLP